MASKRVALKYCGLTVLADVLEALKLKIDYLGFNFWPNSKRYVTAAAARHLWLEAHRLKAELANTNDHDGSYAMAVGILVNPTLDHIKKCLDDFPELTAIQLHGQELPSLGQEARRLIAPRTLWKALPVTSADSPASVSGALTKWTQVADLILFDAARAPGPRADAKSVAIHSEKNQPEVWGGIGLSFDWSLLDEAHRPDELSSVAWGLAGGIDTKNIGDALKLKPAVVDVCSGIELSPGKKDPEKMREIAQIRNQTEDPHVTQIGSAPPRKTPCKLVTLLLTTATGACLLWFPPTFAAANEEQTLRSSIHTYDRYVLNFRREHNFAVVTGLTRGTWDVKRFGDISEAKFPANGIFSRFQYSFHLPFTGGFGWMLGSGVGYHYESANSRRTFRPVSAWQFPGLLVGLVYNFSSVVRFSTTAEAYLERHEGLRNKLKSIYVTSNVFDFGAALDIFYDLSLAVRLEYHSRQLLYEKPFIPADSAEPFDVDAKIRKKDQAWGLGLVYHLI